MGNEPLYTLSSPATLYAAYLAMAVLVSALLAAHYFQNRTAMWIFKPLASTVFIFITVTLGALESHYGIGVLVALALFWISDVLLIPEHRLSFYGGAIAALLGHLAYMGAFFTRGLSPTGAVIAALVLLIPFILVHRWLGPHLPANLKTLVRIYTGVFVCMVAFAAGTVAMGGRPTIVIGAVMFFISDLAVARHRFVQKSLTNKLWGLPLYYAAQTLLAASVALH